jgi:hypothetical protein
MLAADGKGLLVRALSIDDEGEQHIYRVSVLKFGSGDQLCELEDCGLLTVAELKWLVEAKTGLDPELTVLLHAEHGELNDGVRLTDLVGLPTTELYAQTLMKVSVAQHLGIAPHEVTNDQFTTLCTALVSEPLDIMELRGCTQVCDFSLLSLSLSKLDISDCNLCAEGGKALAAGLKGNQAITELNVSNNSLGMDSDHDAARAVISGIIAIADVIGEGAISSVNLLLNKIGIDQARALASILKEHPTLKSLCGNKGNETELDMNGKMDGAADAIMLVPEISDNGAMTKLDISKCELRAEGGKALAAGLKGNQVMTELNVADNRLGQNVSGGRYVSDMSGVIALADVMPDMGAMTSLNLASNRLGAEGAKIVAEAIKVTICTPTIILVPFSCPSDFSINSCCLLLSAGHGGPIEAYFWW